MRKSSFYSVNLTFEFFGPSLASRHKQHGQYILYTYIYVSNTKCITFHNNKVVFLTAIVLYTISHLEMSSLVLQRKLRKITKLHYFYVMIEKINASFWNINKECKNVIQLNCNCSRTILR